MTKDELQNTVDKLADKFFANGVVTPTTYIEQISFLFFAKMLEEEENGRIQAAKLAGKNYKSIFDGKNEKYRWSIWSVMPDTQAMFKFVRDDLITFFQTGIQDHEDVKKFFLEVHFFIPDAILLSEVVDIISKIEFSKIDADIKGDMYEHLTSRLATAGRIGSFRTPRHIIRTIVKMVDPKIGQTICDPACGTAGFLLAAYEHIKSQNSKTTLEYTTLENGDSYQKGKGDLLGEKDWIKLENETFWGFDVTPDSIKIAIMNMLLHGLAAKNVYRRDSLAGTADPEEEMSWNVILANPPFAGDIKESRILAKYELGKNAGGKYQTKVGRDILFIERNLDFLKPGGRMAIVLPQGRFNNSSDKQIREFIAERCRILGVVGLHGNVFKPHTGTKTSVLLVQKSKIGQAIQARPFFFSSSVSHEACFGAHQPTASMVCDSR